MKIQNVIVGLALIAPLSVAWAAKPVDPESLPKVDCAAFKFSPAFLEKYPQAPQACLEGREKDGVRYAKFSAKVYLNSPDRTTVQLLNAAGDSLTTFSIRPKPGAGIMINGKKVKFTEISPGEVITFWVPESRMEVQAMPTSTSDHWTVLPPTGQ